MLSEKTVFSTGIFILINFFVVASFAQEEMIFNINLNFNSDNNTLKLLDVYTKPGFAQERKITTGYILEIISFDNKTLHRSFFEIENVIHFLPPSEGGSAGSIILKDFNFTLTAPYFKNAKEIRISSPKGALLLPIDVSLFADFCGDGLCKLNENFLICPSDCPLVSPKDEIFVIAIIVAIVIIIAIIKIKKYLEKNKWESLERKFKYKIR